jgi:hypothetical protein
VCYTFLNVYLFCVFTFLQTAIKEFNLKKTLMQSKERRLSYSIAFKVEVMNYAEKHGSEASSENNCEDDFSCSDDDFLFL